MTIEIIEWLDGDDKVLAEVKTPDVSSHIGQYDLSKIREMLSYIPKILDRLYKVESKLDQVRCLESKEFLSNDEMESLNKLRERHKKIIELLRECDD